MNAQGIEMREHVALEYGTVQTDAGEMEDCMDGRLRNMASIYISKGNKMLLLYRQGGRVVNDVWVGSAGGHFEECDTTKKQGRNPSELLFFC